LPAGRYQLLIQATDFSNNSSGNLAYKIQFVVDDQNKIVEVRTYPNPTYQSSALLFSIAGKELPKYLDFEVFDFQGQKVFTKRLAGNTLTYGSNVILNAWDGHSTSGRKVLSGLYSYRLVAPNGSAVHYSQAPTTTRFGKIVVVN
jgi:flagellar hook assembly protein FlgD